VWPILDLAHEGIEETAAMSATTTLSPDELGLLRLMAEVDVPLRIGELGQTHFVGRQTVFVGFGASLKLNALYRAELVELRPGEGKPPWASDYVLTEKGREAAGSGD